jgi:hypothetical protein
MRVDRDAVIKAVRSVLPGTTCRGDAIISAVNALPDEWLPIERYKKGRALFYCPALIEGCISVQRSEYFTFERPLRRPPTHFMLISTPDASINTMPQGPKL